MSLKTDACIMVMGRGVGLLLGLVSWGLINRELGPSGRGQYAEIITWVTMIALVSGMSIEKIVHHFAKRDIYEFPDALKGVLVLLLSSLLSMIGCSLFIGMTMLFPHFLSTSYTTSFHLFTMLVTTQLVANVALVFLRSIGDIKYCMITMVSQSLLQILVVLIASVFNALTLSFCLYMTLAVQILAIFFFIRALHQRGSLHLNISDRYFEIIGLIKKILIAGLKVHIATIAMFIALKFNQIMLMRWSGDVESGLYSTSLQFVAAVMMVPMAIQSAMYPRIIHNNDDYQVTELAMRFYVYGWSVVTLVLIACAPWAIRLYAGEAFASAAPALRILFVAYWFMQLSALAAPYLIKQGAFWFFSISGVVTAFVSVAANYLLIRNHGAIGAAYATLIATTMIFVMTMYFVRILSGRVMNICFLKKKDVLAVAHSISLVVSGLRRRTCQEV